MSFRTWKVPAIIRTVPILLQLSLALFLLGLVIILWELNREVAIVVSTLVSVSLAFTVGSAMMPALLDGCPYHTPQALLFIILTRLVAVSLRWVLRPLGYQIQSMFAHISRRRLPRWHSPDNRL
ncbi:hypothetical protein WOLCODRAFT_23874, partial [Wolfiporia cocos MD-104 SS10]